MASSDSFCSLLRACAVVTCPRILVSFGTRTSPLLVFMSCVTVATTSSPLFAFFASTVLVNCTGMTLPGAILTGLLVGAAGCVAAAAGCPAAVDGCGWDAPGSLPEAGGVFCAIEGAHSKAPKKNAVIVFFTGDLLFQDLSTGAQTDKPIQRVDAVLFREDGLGCASRQPGIVTLAFERYETNDVPA